MVRLGVWKLGLRLVHHWPQEEQLGKAWVWFPEKARLGAKFEGKQPQNEDPKEIERL